MSTKSTYLSGADDIDSMISKTQQMHIAAAMRHDMSVSDYYQKILKLPRVPQWAIDYDNANPVYVPAKAGFSFDIIPEQYKKYVKGGAAFLALAFALAIPEQSPLHGILNRNKKK